MWHKISQVPHIRGWVGGVDGVGSGLRLPFRHNGISCCAKGAVNGLQTTPQAKAGRPNNSHGLLGAVSHQCHLIKACQALSQSYQSSTGS